MSEQEFINSVFEAIDFQLDDECQGFDLDPGLIEEITDHASSFYHRAMPYFDAENDKRIEAGQTLKSVSDLGHDFVFTALGHGVGFWEKSESDWLYYNDILEGLAEKYFYSGYGFYLGDDNLVYGG